VPVQFSPISLRSAPSTLWSPPRRRRRCLRSTPRRRSPVSTPPPPPEPAAPPSLFPLPFFPFPLRLLLAPPVLAQVVVCALASEGEIDSSERIDQSTTRVLTRTPCQFKGYLNLMQYGHELLPCRLHAGWALALTYRMATAKSSRLKEKGQSSGTIRSMHSSHVQQPDKLFAWDNLLMTRDSMTCLAIHEDDQERLVLAWSPDENDSRLKTTVRALEEMVGSTGVYDSEN
ncbi:unnamed protein product, partial [Urochloa humidicola]